MAPAHGAVFKGPCPPGTYLRFGFTFLSSGLSISNESLEGGGAGFVLEEPKHMVSGGAECVELEQQLNAVDVNLLNYNRKVLDRVDCCVLLE